MYVVCQPIRLVYLFTSSTSPHSEHEKHCGCQHLSPPALSAKIATSPGHMDSPHPAQLHGVEEDWVLDCLGSYLLPVTIGSSFIGGGMMTAGAGGDGGRCS